MTGRSRTSKSLTLPASANGPRPIDDDGFPDVAVYNEELAKRGSPTWLNTEWLFVECYLFR